ncbi:MAG: hypothetical protein WCK55_10805 [Verrucomicrobiota bacterium]
MKMKKLLIAAIALWLQKNTLSAQTRPVAPAGQPPTVAPAAAPSPTKATPSTVSPKKKFAEMGVLERNAILDEIEKQDLPAIFQAMLDADRVEHDSRKQMHLQTTFSNAFLRKKPSPEFLEQMYGFVTNPANSQFERDLLIGALEGAATKESVELLLRIAKTAPEEKTRQSAATLSGVASNSLTERDVLPLLERTWRETSNPTLLRSTSAGMAKIGTPSGIELLLSAALATDKRDKARQQAAYSALQETYRDDAVPPLAARLANQPPDSEAVKLVAPVLARIGDATAGKALVDWLRGRNENAAPLIDDLIRQRWLRNPFEAGWAAALDPAVPFKNEENRKAIREALDAYRAGRTRR